MTANLLTALTTSATGDCSGGSLRDVNIHVLEEIEIKVFNINTPTEALGLVLSVGGGGQEG